MLRMLAHKRWDGMGGAQRPSACGHVERTKVVAGESLML